MARRKKKATAVDRPGAQRGKGLATKFPLRETEGEKGMRERGDMEGKEGGVRRPPIFTFLSPLLSFLSPLPPSVWLFSLHSLSLFLSPLTF